MKLGGIRPDYKFVRAPDLLNVAVQNDLYSCSTALGFEQVHNILGGAVAEKLAERLLVIRNVVPFNQRDEVGRFVPRQGGFREMGIFGIEMFRPAMEVGEIAAASAGDKDFLPRAIGAFQDRDSPATFAGLDGAHQPRGSGAQNYRIEFVDHDRQACTAKPLPNDYCIPCPGLDWEGFRHVSSQIPSICYIADKKTTAQRARNPLHLNGTGSKSSLRFTD